jgi:hypothetical protein
VKIVKFELPEAVKPFLTPGTLLRAQLPFIIVTASGSTEADIGALFMVHRSRFDPDKGHVIFVLLTRELVEAGVRIHVEKLPRYISVVES